MLIQILNPEPLALFALSKPSPTRRSGSHTAERRPLESRYRSCKGLRWRLGSRLDLDEGDVAASLETTLMLALREDDGAEDTGALVACAELSMRPVDGKLVEEFAIPAAFCLHTADALGAYLSNVAVDPSRRGRGYATLLLRACEAVVRDVWQQQDLYLHCNLEDAATSRLYAGYEHLVEFDSVCQPLSAPGAEEGGGTSQVATSSAPQAESESWLVNSTTTSIASRRSYHRRRLQ